MQKELVPGGYICRFTPSELLLLLEVCSHDLGGISLDPVDGSANLHVREGFLSRRLGQARTLIHALQINNYPVDIVVEAV